MLFTASSPSLFFVISAYVIEKNPPINSMEVIRRITITCSDHFKYRQIKRQHPHQKLSNYLPKQIEVNYNIFHHHAER